jgi:hypothetical protein
MHARSVHLDLPDLLRVRQTIDAPRLEDPAARLRELLDAFGLADKVAPGACVALAVGSRGLRDLQSLVGTLAEAVARAGGSPFIVPCMGSHGGATAEGQAAVLAEYGVTEETCGAPVVSTMDAVEVGRSCFGAPVWVSPDLLQADAVVVLNRVKPHTDFSGPIESGIAKMLVVGAGKHRGAVEAHRLFVRHGFSAVLEEYAALLLERLPVLCAVALIDNQLDETAELHVLEPGEVLAGEPALLRRARELMPALPFSRLDCLVVDEMGKDISGAGMDTNVLGRKPDAPGGAGDDAPGGPVITRVFVRDLSRAGGGNATGIGVADFTTTRLTAAIDAEATRINALTAMAPEVARLPMAFDEDLDALEAAYATCGASSPADFRLAWIRSTLEVGELLVSGALAAEVEEHPRLKVLEGPFPFPVDAQGRLTPSWASGRTMYVA